MAEQGIDLGRLEIDHREQINNSDIIHLVGLIDQGLYQLGQAQSASLNLTNPEDLSIAENWLNRWEKTMLVFAAIPHQFMPNASPMPKKLPTPPDLGIVQNPSFQNLMYVMTQMRTQLLFNEDSQQLNGFHPDHVRATIKPWVEKFRQFVALMKDIQGNPELAWTPEADMQPVPVNPGTPR